MIVLISHLEDETTDWLELVAKARKIDALRINTDDLLVGRDITVDYGGTGSATLKYHERKITSCGIFDRGSRYKLGRKVMQAIQDRFRDFVSHEMHDLLFGGLLSIPNVYWMNRPEAAYLSDIKIHQLNIAGSVGLRTPATIVSSSGEELRRFWEIREGRVVTKAIHKGFVAEGGNEGKKQVLFTSRVEKQHLAKLQEINLPPLLFQEEVNKSVELRVVIFGDQVFACEIEADSSVADWRTRGSMMVGNSKAHVVPEGVVASCREMLTCLRLNFGVFDLVIDKEGHYVFLEVNQQGNWLWMETVLGMPIAEEIIKILAKE